MSESATKGCKEVPWQAGSVRREESRPERLAASEPTIAEHVLHALMRTFDHVVISGPRPQYTGPMTRPLRLEFPGVLYHVTSRGNARRAIFIDDDDRQQWMEILASICARLHVEVHAYCQMTNHYHLMLETAEGNLSQAMRQLNAFYAQYFNRRHGQVGHLFQGRFKAILVEKENYLLELARYIVLNPVRAGMVADAKDWPWSSYNFTTMAAVCPTWLNIEWLLSQFGDNAETALPAYRQFVLCGVGRHSPLREVQHQMVLGSEAIVAGHSEHPGTTDFTAVSKTRRRLATKTLLEYARTCSSREDTMAQAYRSTANTMAEIGKHFNVSYQTVSRAVRRDVLQKRRVVGDPGGIETV